MKGKLFNPINITNHNHILNAMNLIGHFKNLIKN